MQHQELPLFTLVGFRLRKANAKPHSLSIPIVKVNEMFGFIRSPEKKRRDYQYKILMNISKKGVQDPTGFLATAFDSSATNYELKLIDKLFLKKARPEVASVFIAADHVQQVGQGKRKFCPAISVPLLVYLSNAVAARIPDLSYTSDETRILAKNIEMEYGEAVAGMFQNQEADDWPYRNFDEWYDEFLGELKRMDRESLVDGLHYVELMDEGPLKKAFTDRKSPKKIASDFVKYSSSCK